MNQSGNKTEHFHVVGISSHTDALKKLASLNPEWQLSPEEIVASGRADQKIYKLKFVNKPVQLQKDPTTGALNVLISGEHVGHIQPSETPRVKEIIKNYEIQNVACGIWGGQYKTVDEFYGVETQQQGLSITLRLTYEDWSDTIEDDLLAIPDEEEQSAKPSMTKEAVKAKKKEKSKKKKAKKSIFKRWWFWVIVVLLAVGLFGGGNAEKESSASSDDNITTATESSSTQSVTVPQATSPVAVPLEASGSLGDFDVQIHDCEITKDYKGNPAILINFTFANNSDENASASVNLSYIAFQNGVQLEHAYFTDDTRYDASDLLKDVKPSSSIDLTAAYSLTSDTAPVEFEVSKSFSLADDMLGKTYEIAEGGTTVLSTAPSGSVSGEINGCTVSIVSYELVKDYEGKDAILLELGFTNNNDDAYSYFSAIDLTPFQDGIELETAILTGDYENVGNSILSVKPGAGIPVAVAYVLANNTSPVEIEIGDLWGFSNDKIETTINLT